MLKPKPINQRKYNPAAPETYAERYLWLQVIHQAIKDGCHPKEILGGNTNARQKEIHVETIKRQSRAWFSKRVPDFRRVCLFAGVSYDTTIEAAWEAFRYYDEHGEMVPRLAAFAIRQRESEHAAR